MAFARAVALLRYAVVSSVLCAILFGCGTGSDASVSYCRENDECRDERQCVFGYCCWPDEAAAFRGGIESLTRSVAASVSQMSLVPLKGNILALDEFVELFGYADEAEALYVHERYIMVAQDDIFDMLDAAIAQGFSECDGALEDSGETRPLLDARATQPLPVARLVGVTIRLDCRTNGGDRGVMIVSVGSVVWSRWGWRIFSMSGPVIALE